MSSLTTVRLSEAWNWGGLSARELAARTWRAIDRHETIDRAAIVAFYAMLSLVPLLSLSLALASRVGITAEIEDLSSRLLPREAHAIVQDQVKKIERDRPVGLLSLSALLLLWSASSLFVAVMDSTNAAYEVSEGRPWWKKRLVAAALTVVEAVLLVGASASIAAWPEMAAWIGLGGTAKAAATAVQWLVVIVGLLAAFALAYYFGPHIEQVWEWITPGSALGVLALVLASLGFRLYLHYGPAYSETYGALAGVVLMLLWLYLAGLALLVGAEVNSVIEHAAPHGRQPGQKKAPGPSPAVKTK
jgi:membrane protein